jgi:hypothetical protein
MGHRDLLVTHNLSEGKTHEPRSYLRGSVRRASGFVLTGYSETISPSINQVPQCTARQTLRGQPELRVK